MPQILVYYTIFFFFGAMYFDCDDREAKLGSRWYITLPLALLIIFPLGLEMTTGEWGFSDGWLNSKIYHPIAVLLPVVYVWLMTFGIDRGRFAESIPTKARSCVTSPTVPTGCTWLICR